MRFSSLAAMALLLCAPLLCWGTDYGTVNLVAGTVNVLGADEVAYKPRVGDTIHEGDLLSTGADGEIHVTTVDQGLIALRPNTRVKVEEYRAEGGKEDRSILRLLQGRFRTVTGRIGKEHPKHCQVRTVTATIGVRGTDHEPAFVPEGGDPNLPDAAPGTYDKVNEGETFLENKQGKVSVQPNQSGFAPLQALEPVLLATIPGFFTPTKFEDAIQQKRDELQRKLLEPVMQYRNQAEQYQTDPGAAAEQKMRERMPSFPGW